MKNWIVQYVYATEKAEQGVSVVHIQAEDYETARQIAIAEAVAEEFIFTIHPQSEDQFLGSVRHQANMIVGKGTVTHSKD